MLARRTALFVCIAGFFAAAPASAQPVSTTGDCSPIISDVNGNVSIVCNLAGPAGPQFRVSYYRVSGLGLSFLLDGKLSAEWAERLGGQHAIVPNAVSKEARRFIDRFSTPIRGSVLYGYAGSNEDIDERLADYAKEVDPTVEITTGDLGSHADLDPDKWRAYYGDGRNGRLFIPDTAAAQTLFASADWPVGYNALYGMGGTGDSALEPDGTLRPAPLMWRWLTQADLDGFDAGYDDYVRRVLAQVYPSAGGTPIDVSGDEAPAEVLNSRRSQDLMKGIDSIRYLAREGLPARFLMIEGFLGGHYGWSFTSTPRDFQMLVAVMENTGQQAIDIGEFALRETQAMTLRTAAESASLLDNSQERRQTVFPIGVLQPGEKILIPVRIELAQSELYVDRQEELDDNAFNGRRTERALAAAGNTSVTAVDYNLIALFTKPASAYPPQSTPQIVERFEYGPAWRIDSVSVNGEDIAFRQHDPNNFIVMAGAEVGSCPFAFSYQPDGDLWLNEGHFLFGATTPQLKRTEEKTLPNFRGRVMVRELEHEIVFLDMIRLKLTDANGNETIHLPVNAALRDEDGEEIRLAYGEGIELDFGLEEKDWQDRQASLVAAGYYINFSYPELFAAKN